MLEILQFALADWFLVVPTLILFLLFTCQDNGWAATSLLGISLICMHFFCGVNVFGFLASHPLEVLFGLLGYFLVGSLWAVVKWSLFVRDRLERYTEMKREWLREHQVFGTLVIPDSLKEEWKKFLSTGYIDNFYDYRIQRIDLTRPPSVLENKSRILNWMAFWIPSLLYSLSHDFVRRVFKAIYAQLSKTLQAIADRMYANSDVSQDLPSDVNDRT